MILLQILSWAVIFVSVVYFIIKIKFEYGDLGEEGIIIREFYKPHFSFIHWTRTNGDA